MGEGLFLHASNSLGVITIARSIIVPFEEGGKNTHSSTVTLSVFSQTRPSGTTFGDCLTIITVLETQSSENDTLITTKVKYKTKAQKKFKTFKFFRMIIT